MTNQIIIVRNNHPAQVIPLAKTTRPAKSPPPTRTAAQQQELARLTALLERWLIGDMKLTPQAYRATVTALARIYPDFARIWQHIQTGTPLRSQPPLKTWELFNTCLLIIAKKRMPAEIRAVTLKMKQLSAIRKP